MSLDVNALRRLAQMLNGTRVQHREYRKALSLLRSHIMLPSPNMIVVMTGPTRINKTTIATAAYKELMNHNKDDRFRPAAWAEAVNTRAGNISTIHLIDRLLSSIDHPIFGRPDAYESGGKPPPHATESTLRRAFENGFELRGGKVIFVDEGHHLVHTLREVRAREVLDSIKSLANRPGIAIVASAGYSILKHLDYAHFDGRLRYVHVRRYDPKKKADATEFKGVYAAFVGCATKAFEELAISVEPALWSIMQPAFCKVTEGISGLIPKWTLSALAHMNAEGELKLRKRHFEDSWLDVDFTAITEEIREGEEWFDLAATRKNVMLRTTLKRASTAAPPKDKPTKTTRKRKGIRNPVRDPVGPLQ